MNEQEIFELKLERFGGPVFSGRDRGELARTEAELDQLDEASAIVHTIVPEDALTVTSSFILGMYGPSIKKAGSREQFLQKYTFSIPETFLKTLNSCIDRALRPTSSLIISKDSENRV